MVSCRMIPSLKRRGMCHPNSWCLAGVHLQWLTPTYSFSRWKKHPQLQWDIPLHRPYIGLIYGRYLQFRILKWPRQLLYICRYHRGSTHCFPLSFTMLHHASPWKPPCQERYESLKARRGAGEAVDPGVLPVISYSLLRRKWSFIDLLILIYHDVPLRNGDVHWFSIARLVYQRVSSSAHGYMMGILNSIYILYVYIYIVCTNG